jgi:hypothetical protein
MTTATRQKIAVILSCDYSGRNQLHGCVNDGNDIRQFLIKERGFKASNITTVYNSEMTVKGIWTALKGMVDQSFAVAKLGQIPTMFLYYSGHGLLVPNNRDMDEDENNADSALVPWDHEKNGFIIDEQLYSRFITQLHHSTELFIFPDCCYSGSNFDLKYRSITQRADVAKLETKIIQLSGCRDDQTSAEIGGHGLATAAFLKLMRRINPPYSLKTFKKDIGDVSTPGHPQHPQVSFSRADMRGDDLFDWLVANVGGTQESGRKIKKLARKCVRENFGKRLGVALKYLFGNDHCAVLR